MQTRKLSLTREKTFARPTESSCTSIVAGPKATADGSLFAARSVDVHLTQGQRFVQHPAADYPAGSRYESKTSKFTYPHPKHALRYFGAPLGDSGQWSEMGFNEAGVGVSATETIFARDDALALDPYVKEDGITEGDINDVLLERAKSAKEAVKILGRIIETQGTAEGFGVSAVDAKEVWYLETGTGHQWMARRIPADSYFASANQGRFQEYKEGAAGFLGSPTLVSWATEQGFYDPKRDGEFNFSRAYTRNDKRDRTYNDPRVWQIQRLFNPSFKQQIADGRQFPEFLKPEKKLTLADLKTAFRNHYENAELRTHDPYSHGLRGSEPYRPICIFRTLETHILQVRPKLPPEIGNIAWVAFGMAELSVFVPFFQGFTKQPKGFDVGAGDADDNSAYWKYRKLQTLAMGDYPRFAPRIKAAYAELEQSWEKKLSDFDAKYLKTVSTDAKKADKLLQDFNTAILRESLQVTSLLTNEIFTALARDIEKAAPFTNRGKAD